MRSRVQAVVLPFEVGDFADEVRLVFSELARTFGPEVTGECAPAVDVVETDDALNVAVDLPGVDPAAIRVLAKGELLLIAGEKRRRAAGADSTFHLVERDFGRFARTVRLTRACDPARAQATLVDGELRVVVPKISERRGRRIDIPVNGVRDVAAQQ